jgi:hypothetical protein
MDSPARIHSYRFPLDGKSYLALIAKRSYRIRPGGRAELAAEQAAITDMPAYLPSTNPGAGDRLEHDSDLFAPVKPLTDVLLRGSAHSSKGPVESLEVTLEVGPVKRAIRARGDHRVVLGAGSAIGFSAPERFTSLPLTWDNAYGGRDLHAEAKLFDREEPRRRFRRARDQRPSEAHGGLLYPRNYAGRGFVLDLDRERFEGLRLPNLDDPDDPLLPERLAAPNLEAWIDCPASACFEPIDWLTFPRAAFLISPDHAPPQRPIRELALGALLGHDLEEPAVFGVPRSARFYNAAPAGLSVARLQGGERVMLHNLHPSHPRLEFDLPGERPRLIIEPPGVGARELDPLLQTVFLYPDDLRVELTWAGALEVAMPYPEAMVKEMRRAALWSR